MTRAVAGLLLLALAACGQPGDKADAPGNMTAGSPGPAPAQGLNPAPAEMNMDTGHAPPERFIVCPGNPRCPPEGQPKGQQTN